MEFVDMLLCNSPKTSSKRIEIVRGYALYKCKEQKITVRTIRDMLNFLCAVQNRFKCSNIPICFDLQSATFLDKLTILIFECLCYALVTHYHQRVLIVGYNLRQGIISEGARSSPLLLLTTGKLGNEQKFIDKFKYDLYNNHFRQIVPASAVFNPLLSQVMHDIDTFLKNLSVQEKYRRDIANVIVELIGNAGEHGNAATLVDVDVTNDYNKNGEEGRFRGLNLAMISLSDVQFGEALQRKICDMTDDDYNDRYVYVKRAYANHSQFFSEMYRPQDFFSIAAFQHNISGRPTTSLSGGTGLTKLIRSLEDMADAHACCMLAGDRRLWFLREFLEYNDENWIGFNKERSLMDAPPDGKVLSDSDLFMPGTAFNLCFVMKEEN